MKRWLSYRFRRTTLLLLGCWLVLGSVGLAHFSIWPGGYWYLLAAIPAIWLVPRRGLGAIICLILLCGGMGWQRGSAYMDKLAVYQPLYGEKITLTAQALNDATYSATTQLAFDASDIRLANGELLTGRIQLSGFGLNAVFHGDEVRATGKLYPAYGAYQGRISYGQLTLIRHHPSLVADIRRRFAAGLQTALPEPLSSFALGLLIGQRTTLPPEVKQDLLQVGLTHIIAVSGYNLTIMLGASRRLMGKRSKRLSTFTAIGLMLVFLLLTGASASIVRAAIVSMLSIATGYYGRTFKPLQLICLAAAITAVANPVYIWSDVSWWLSFLAFFGVLVLAPSITSRFRAGWQRSIIVAVALESLCAEAMTLPFVLHTFGQMSLIGLPANVLVVTLIPLAMLLCVIAGMAGMLMATVAGWFAWPARLLLTYMLDLAHVLAHVRHIFLQQIGLSITQMLGLYAVVAAISWSLWVKTKRQNHAKVTDRKLQHAKEFAT